MSKEIYMPSWILSINVNEIKVYNIDFRQTSNYSYLKESILRGEYISNQPFGLAEINNKIYYFIPKEKDPEPYIFVNREFGEIQESIEKMIPIIFFSTLIKTTIDHTLERHGYEKPYNVRGCLGRFSKGILSNHNKKIIISKRETGLLQDYYLSPAEQFDIIYLEKKEFLVTYLTKWELLLKDTGLKLPQNTNIKLKLSNSDTWKKTVYWNPKDYFSKFLPISKMIKENFKDSFSEIRENINYKKKKLDRIEEIYVDRNIIKINKNNAFSEELKEKIDISKAGIKKYVFFVEDSLSENSNIKNFISLFFKWSGIDQSPIIYYSRNNDFLDSTLDAYEVIIIIVDSDRNGLDFFYSQIKQSLKTKNKIILSDSIEESKEEWQNIFLSIILSLFSRINKKSLYEIETELSSDINSFHLVKNYDLLISILFYGNYSNTTGKYTFKLKFFPLKNSVDLINNYLNKQFKKNSIILTLENYEHVEILEKLKNYTKLQMRRLKGRIFEIIKNQLEKPENGTYIKLSEKKYILINTGKPDYNKEGLPNPILITINEPEKKKNHFNIIKAIYQRSFINFETISKNLLPFILHRISNFGYNFDIINRISEIESEDIEL